MDKETLSNYGWIVILVLILAVLLAFATPFGNFIADGFKATFLGFGYTNNTMLDGMFETTGTPPSIDYLQSKYQFDYYSSFGLAVLDANDGSRERADVDKKDAVAGIYTDEKGGTVVVLLKDGIETATVNITSDMIINLGGNTLAFNNTSVGISTSDTTAPNITIDGRLSGSTITLSHNGDETGSRNTSMLLFNSGSCKINNGTYQTISTKTGFQTSNYHKCIYIRGTSDVTISNATISATETDYGFVATIEVDSSSTLTVSNSSILAKLNYGGKAQSIKNSGTTIITNNNIYAYSHYRNGKYVEGGSATCGTVNNGTMTINDCYIIGTHSGVTNNGALYVNGGTYEGYGHGGFYFGGMGKTAYVRNATIKECPMPDGYTATGACNNSGLYIGGATGNDNITVYMDNCDIYGSRQPIVLRDTDGEQNNSLYISNSTINLDCELGIRIDNNTHRLHIGMGNNFTSNDVYLRNDAVLSNVVIVTNETYTQN